MIPSGLSPQPTDVPLQDDDGNSLPPQPAGPSVLDAAASASSAALAVKAMRLFARPSAPANRWWHDLEPLLTPDAQTAYRNTDPARVPVTSITGAGTVLSDSVPLVARVSVPTDVGAYLVIVVRTADRLDQWLVSQIVPPEVIG